jgi:hypothetical protein
MPSFDHAFIISKLYDDSQSYRENQWVRHLSGRIKNISVLCACQNSNASIVQNIGISLPFGLSIPVSLNGIKIEHRYALVIALDSYQLLTAIYTFLFQIRYGKNNFRLVYEHEQRSLGIRFHARILNILRLPALWYLCSVADIIRSPNPLSTRFLLRYAGFSSRKIVELPLDPGETFEHYTINKQYPVKHHLVYSHSKRIDYSLVWTGKNPSSKGLDIIVSALKCTTALACNITLRILFSGHISQYAERAASDNPNIVLERRTLSASDLATFFASADLAVWLTATQSMWDCLAVQTPILVPSCTIPKILTPNSENYGCYGVKLDCDHHGIPKYSSQNIMVFRDSLIGTISTLSKIQAPIKQIRNSIETITTTQWIQS